MPEVEEYYNSFVIVDNNLHNEFDKFKRENVPLGTSILGLNDLLKYYVSLNPQLQVHLRYMYGKIYIHLPCDLVDDLCQWIYCRRDEGIIRS